MTPADGSRPAPRAFSLRARLLGLLGAAILVTAVLQGMVAYRSARAEADQMFDYHMQQMALALRAGLPVGPSPFELDVAVDEIATDFVVQVWTANGLQVFRSSAHVGLPQRAVLGFADVAAQGRQFRVFSLQARDQVIQVAQDMAMRRAMAGSMALRTVAPVAVVAPLLMLLVWWLVSASMAPVARLSRQVASRQADALDEVAEAGLPSEVAPLVHELNALFARLRQAFDAQQRFVADAAHELRTPLAALKLQVQGLKRADDEPTRTLAVTRLNAGIDRATRLVEQLLLLARQQASASSGAAASPVCLADLARQAVADAAERSRAGGIDLGLVQADTTTLPGHAHALAIALRNLIDNALKHSPPGGAVDVAVVRDGPRLLLSVDDSGPGIPADQRARVLDRFYRVQGTADEATGSGLGLAIVKAIAELHGASLSLDDSASRGGLRVVMGFDLERRQPLAGS